MGESVSSTADEVAGLVQRQLQGHGERDGGGFTRLVRGIAADLREQFSVDVRPLVHLGVGDPAFVDHAQKGLGEGFVYLVDHVFQLTTAESVEEAERARRVIG